jgi:hypothetical protein
MTEEQLIIEALEVIVITPINQVRGQIRESNLDAESKKIIADKLIEIQGACAKISFILEKKNEVTAALKESLSQFNQMMEAAVYPTNPTN